MTWLDLRHSGGCAAPAPTLTHVLEFRRIAALWCRHALAQHEKVGDVDSEDECIVFVDARGRRVHAPPTHARAWHAPGALTTADSRVLADAFADMGFEAEWIRRQSVAYAVSMRKAAQAGHRRAMIIVHGDDNRRLPRRGDRVVHAGRTGTMLCAHVDGDCQVEFADGTREWVRRGRLARRISFYAFSCAL